MAVDLNNTLEQLDKQVWNDPGFDSHLVMTCHLLRKKPLKDFTIEDLRILIGQNIDLEFLIPLALEQLQENILAEGNYYEGDLLNNVLTSENEYWLKNKKNWRKICELFEQNSTRLEQFDTTREIKNNWIENFKMFKAINNQHNS